MLSINVTRRHVHKPEINKFKWIASDFLNKMAPQCHWINLCRFSCKFSVNCWSNVTVMCNIIQQTSSSITLTHFCCFWWLIRLFFVPSLLFVGRLAAFRLMRYINSSRDLSNEPISNQFVPASCGPLGLKSFYHPLLSIWIECIVRMLLGAAICVIVT